MQQSSASRLVALDTNEPIWDQFFMVMPLVLAGTKEEDGSYDLAPKHMVMPMSWDNYVGFVCTPRHGTYHNVERDEEANAFDRQAERNVDRRHDEQPAARKSGRVEAERCDSAGDSGDFRHAEFDAV